MKKKIFSLFLLVSLFFTFTLLTAPVKVFASDEAIKTTVSAIDYDSNALVNGEGYFIKTDDESIYEFYYTNYNGVVVEDFSIESTSLYIKKIRISSLPYNWFNETTGLDPVGLGTVGIIEGKWSLLNSYLTDMNGNILPNSIGYLQESVYADCRRYVYYLSYRNKEGVDRPIYDKHYEAIIDIESIPSYLLSEDGKNEIMGIYDGLPCYTEIVKYNAIRQIDYYEEIHYGSTDLDSLFGDRYLFPVIYFNIHEIDYDYLLSVEFSYTVNEHKKTWYGSYVEEIVKKYNFSDVLSFDEFLVYQENFKTFLDYFAMAGSSSDASLNYITYLTNSEWHSNFHSGNDSTSYVALQSGSWTKDIVMPNGIETEKNFNNRMVGHLTNLVGDKGNSNNYKNKFTLEKNSVKFLSVSYVYDGILYTNDERVPINSTDYTPDDVFNDTIFDSILKDVLDSVSKLPAAIVNTGVDLGLSFFSNFWKNLSPVVKVILVLSLIALVVYFTYPLWYPLIAKRVYKNDQLSLSQSYRLSNNRSANHYQNKQRKNARKDYKQQRKDLKEDREYISGRADLKYIHEQNKIDSYERMNNARYEHENNKLDYYDRNNEKRYAHEQNKLDSYERMNNARYTHEDKKMDFYDRNNEKRYKHETKKMKYYGKLNKKSTPNWYPSYLKEEKRKMKNNKDNNYSNDSLEDLNDFFNKKK